MLIAGLLVAAFFVGAKYNADDKPGSSTATATKLLNQALRAQVAGDKASATKTFKLVLDIDPQNKLAHYNLGLIAQQRGDEAEADAAYRRAIGIDREFARLYNLGIVRAGVGDTPEAIILYTRATKADPEIRDRVPEPRARPVRLRSQGRGGCGAQPGTRSTEPGR